MSNQPRVMGPDGIVRAEAEERRINDAVKACFGTPSGRAVLDYLTSITINHILGPAASDAELRDMEGRRTIVAMLNRRLHVRDDRARDPRFDGTRPGGSARRNSGGGPAGE